MKLDVLKSTEVDQMIERPSYWLLNTLTKGFEIFLITSTDLSRCSLNKLPAFFYGIVGSKVTYHFSLVILLLYVLTTTTICVGLM